jgi:4-hydroxy-3-polyprenylbenzoate decarboxylase
VIGAATPGGVRRIVVGITGASGAPYARRLLDVLAALRAGANLEVAAVLGSTAREVWALECGGAPEDAGVPVWEGNDFRAPFASGSARWHAMAIVPCSMGTAARVAQGTSDSLLLRAADVMLKERRTLVVVPREMPMSTLHLQNLLELARAGATVIPAAPAFYGKPRTLDDAIDTVVARVLDHLGVEHALGHRWGEGAHGERT